MLAVRPPEAYAQAATALASPAGTDTTEGPGPRAQLFGAVADSASGQPLEHAEVRLLRAGQPVARAVTTGLGRYSLIAVPPGTYELQARRLGFLIGQRTVAVGAGTALEVDLRLPALAQTLAAVAVTAAPAPVAVDTRTGNQVFQQDTHHGSPATTTTQIVQQALAGAARAPTGEVHIRGQHGEFSYRVDGLPVPPGISGSLSELFAPAVVDRIEFLTGGWDAEYGNRNTAIIKVDTRVPAGGFRAEGTAYAGSSEASGQSLVMSGNVGRLGLVLSGARQTTDMRREPVMQDPRTGASLNIHNAGDDRYGFAKLQYIAGARDLITLDANASGTDFQVPYDSSGDVRRDDRQQERNGFANLGWRHALGLHGEDGELFAGIYHRESWLAYVPGALQPPAFVFWPDTVAYNVAEDRTARTTGLKLDALLPTWESAWGTVQLKTGADVSQVRGHEHFATRDGVDRPGPAIDAPVRGGDVGVYLQASIQPAPWWELRPGVRYDVHTAPLADHAVQLSPRLRLNLYPSPTTSLWLYYGRLFVPSAVEDFHVLATAGQEGQTGQPTRPQRDHFFEAGLVRQIPAHSLTLKLDAYHKRSSPAVDDNVLPGTALNATVDVAQVRVTGIESVVEVRPAGPLGGYINIALSHAIAHGPITGGFSPTAFPDGWYDMDHDQRLSAVGHLSYDRHRWHASATAIYGSGLTNGHPLNGITRLGLFDFNPAVKVAPSMIVNASMGGVVPLLGRALRPQLFVDNLFDRQYVLKGAFTSGAAIGRPRTLILRFELGE